MEVCELGKAIRLNKLAQVMQVHTGTIYRWSTTGVRGKRLRTVLIGGRRAVLPSDLEQFLREDGQAAESAGEHPGPDRNTHARALRQLSRHGLLD